jgi:hypothetical protein
MIPKGRAYQDEDFAKELHRHLKDQLSGLCADAEVSYAWSGVHWECLVRRGDRTTNIFCFEARRPRYCISFQENAREAGTALASKAEVLAAVSEWILGGPFEALYDKFDFVGRVARELAAIRDEALALAPELSQLMPPELRPMPDPYELWFRVEGRTCRVLHRGSRIPDFLFNWDETEMFSVRTRDPKVFSVLLKRWLCDQAPPSALKLAMPQIELSRLARHYEEGRPIEGEFICSWDFIEDFYTELSDRPSCRLMLDLVSQIRSSGRERTLRAGQSILTLMLSRSRRHGLRDEQPCVAIDIDEAGMMTVSAWFEQRQERRVFKRVGLNRPLERILKRLEREPIS